MFITREYFIGLSDIGAEYKATNKSLLTYCENTCGIQSDIVGLGVLDIEKTKLSWILMNWKLKVINRPLYGTKIKVTTWSKGTDKLYAYRDFEITDEKGETLVIVTSKWLLMNIEKNSIVKFTDDSIMSKYESESKSVFEIDFPKPKEPSNYTKFSEVLITNNLIDVNKHVHNINYIDLARTVLDYDVEVKCENLEILYKKEIKLGEKVKCLYAYENDCHYVVIKTEDEANIHSVIKLY